MGLHGLPWSPRLRMEAGASEDCLPPTPMYGTCLLRLDRMKCDLIAIVHRLGQS